MSDGVEKLIAYVLIAVLGGGSINILLAGDYDNTTVWIGLVVTAATAAALWLKENTPTQSWAKQAVAIFGAVVLAVAYAWTDEKITADEVVAIAIALVGAWQAGTVGNTPAATRTSG